jgi:barrier-to-autointegration factor
MDLSHIEMKSASQKHADFIASSMKNKPIDAIAGIGPVAKIALNAKGFEYAYHLIGQFLIMGKDEILFNTWLQSEVVCMSSKQRLDCTNCVSEYTSIQIDRSRDIKVPDSLVSALTDQLMQLRVIVDDINGIKK